jgi:hypothetical protein
MHTTTVITLAFLMFGQFLILMFGVFILWWIGDFGGTPEPFKDRHAAIQAEDPTIVIRHAGGKLADRSSEGLLPVADGHSIQPQAAEDRMDRKRDVQRAA